MAWWGLLFLWLIGISQAPAIAAEPEQPAASLAQDTSWWGKYQTITPSYNDFGGTGLLQTPTARVAEDGRFMVGASSIFPYRRLLLTAQILPWLESTFRYTQITNRIEQGSLAFGNTQSFYDRGFDLKAQLLEESRRRPALAIGLRDIGGTGLFGAEYIVASKRYYNMDFSLGIGWGNMGTRGHIRNPLSYFGSRFDQRSFEGQGQLSLNYFAGREAAFFGGMEYALPFDGWKAKIEYDGNNYQNEALNNQFKVTSPVNIGLEYQPDDWIHFTGALERGNRLMLRTSLTQLLTKQGTVTKLPSSPPPVQPRAERRPLRTPADSYPLARACTAESPLPEAKVVRIENGTVSVHITLNCRPEADALAEAITMALSGLHGTYDELLVTVIAGGEALTPVRMTVADAGNPDKLIAAFSDDYQQRQTEAKAMTAAADDAIIKSLLAYGYRPIGVNSKTDTVTVWFEQKKDRVLPRTFGRAARLIASAVPDDIRWIELVAVEKGLQAATLRFSRRDIVETVNPYEVRERGKLSGGQALARSFTTYNEATYPNFSWGIEPGFRQSVGGPDQFYAYQIFGALRGELEAFRGGFIGAEWLQDITNNFDQLELASDSRLPRVRSQIQDYLREGKSSLQRLDGQYLFTLAPDLYGKAAGGLFESMFGGYGGEVLYAPFDSRLAIGAEFYKVTQRAFDQRFDFLDYTTTTGHVSFYYDVPFYDLLAKVHAGRYLAGDDGVTFDVSRRFDSGITVGAFATFTDVSAEDFGEGSFDKGFYISFPLDVFFLQSSRAERTFQFRPLTRDGGARLNVEKRLYDVLAPYRRNRLDADWGELLE